MLAACGSEADLGGLASNGTTLAGMGRMVVQVSGLPAGASSAIVVTGPNGFNRLVARTDTLDNLVPGIYTIDADSIVSNANVYAPNPLVMNVSISAGSHPSKKVSYSLASGALQVVVNGLPTGMAAAVTLTGPGGFSVPVTATTTVRGLVPGSYTISAHQVTPGDSLYTPAPLVQTASVSKNLNPVVKSVTYALTASVPTSGLTVGISGLPAGTAGSVTVSGPNGFSELLGATQTLTGLTVGTYTITAAPVTGGAYTWSPLPASQTVSLTSTGSASASVIYSASTGALAVTITGLPSGIAAGVSVTGPGGVSRTVTASSTLTDLVAGTYTVAASSVTSGTTTYTAAPQTQSPAVTTGATGSAAVAYSATSGGGSLDFTVNGAYLVQATQRYDGSVPLVAGRAAYLRVFVLANQPNTASPDVRVRLYNGSTLLQTYSLSAPAAGVPTAVDESSLARSWNVMVPATLVQPGLKVLADVDPNGAFAESDESNNQFPVTGTPAAVDVRSLSTFVLRFVPVLQQVNGLQGNVTTSNAETYLSDLKAMLPIGAYSVDVRSVYTTTAPALDAGNSNGAWSTIINEVYALRNADASGRYYYGVVRTGYTSGVAGLGYVGGSAHTAIGWDWSSSAANVMAHELGHNLGRQHAPCGGASGTDPAYPYSGGSIGVFGLDLANLQIQLPGLGDLMGYCHPNWISDYNWNAMIGYRQASLMNVQAAGDIGGEGLLIWGRVTPGGIVLEPAFKVAAGADVAPHAGPSRLDLLASDGSLLRTVSFATEEIADLPGGPEQHFAFVLPLDARLESALGGLRVRSGGLVASRTMQAAATADPGQEISRPNGEQVQVRWDASRYPMVMVRDATTGEVLSFARGGAARLWTRAGNFDLIYSDGVRSVRRQARDLR